MEEGNASPSTNSIVTDAEQKVLTVSVLGADALLKIKSLNNRSAVVCVVNRHYDFDPAALLREKGCHRKQ